MSLRIPSLTMPSVLSLTLLTVGLTGCTEKPSEEQCSKFADHFVELLTKSKAFPEAKVRTLAEKQRRDLIDKCVAEGTVKDVQCTLEQSSLDAVKENCK